MTAIEYKAFSDLIINEINKYKCPYFSIKTLAYSLKEHPITNDPNINFNRKCSKVFTWLRDKGYIKKWNRCSGHSTYKKLKQILLGDVNG